MSALFWIALTWVLCTLAVARLPLRQRFVPGALLAVTALPILILMGRQMGLPAVLFGLIALGALYPAGPRVLRALWRRERVRFDANLARLMVMPGDLP